MAVSPRVSSLWMYPLKSARGVSLKDATTGRGGFVGDRTWIIVDDDGRFITQRTLPMLARLSCRLTEDSLCLEFEKQHIEVHIPNALNRHQISIWNSDVGATFAGEKAAVWLSKKLSTAVRLYYMDEQGIRKTSSKWSSPVDLSFADSYPYLITSESSLQQLNGSIIESGGDAVPMERFRPNIVLKDAAPWEEDRLKTIRIEGVTFELVKPCNRCVITTIDQVSGLKLGREPLKTLRQIRESVHPEIKGVCFGWYALTKDIGKIGLNQSVVFSDLRQADEFSV